MNNLNLSANIIDVRDITDRVDELREERDQAETIGDWEASSECGELHDLEVLLDELEGMGGDHQWEGAWYPNSLIDDAYFETYAEELAEDVCSDAVANASWPLTCIDWERAARELRMDYSSVEVDGRTYWTR